MPDVDGRRGTAVNDQSSAPVIAAHGAAELPAVVVDSYNVEVKDGDKFVGDNASTRAFRSLLRE